MIRLPSPDVRWTEISPSRGERDAHRLLIASRPSLEEVARRIAKRSKKVLPLQVLLEERAP